MSGASNGQKPIPLTPLEQTQAELSRTNLRLMKVEKQLADMMAMLMTYQRLHQGSQAAMRSWADKISAGVDKRA